DNTTSSNRLSGNEVRKTPGRSITAALSNLEGVSSVDGAMTSVRGNRADGQQMIIDGVRVRGSGGVSMMSIEEAQLIQGGV
ncbi:MAG: TonB-dependent receptor plug domain-containing protein, partial [Bacteroidales bacterium]